MKSAISMVSDFIHRMTRLAAEKKSEKRLFAEDLPKSVKYFVQRNFPGRSIAFVHKKSSLKGALFVVVLNDGILIEFTENGNWEKIDCKMGAVPATMVPCNVATFMKDYYPRVPIVKIEKTDNGYETTLSNFVSLKFNMAENVA